MEAPYDPPTVGLVLPLAPLPPRSTSPGLPDETSQRKYTNPSSEPDIDNLKVEIARLANEAQVLTNNLHEIASLRDRLLSKNDYTKVQELGRLTIFTSDELIKHSNSLDFLQLQVEHLADLVKEGKIAVTSVEVSRINEEIEVLKISLGNDVETIKEMVWEEADNEKERRMALRSRIERENPGLGEKEIAGSVDDAYHGASGNWDQLEVTSYSYWIAVTIPFSEIAQRIEGIAGSGVTSKSDGKYVSKQFDNVAENNIGARTVPRKCTGADKFSSVSSKFSIHFTQRIQRALSGKTLVGSDYDKLDHELDLEGAPLTTSATLGEFSIGGEGDEWEPHATGSLKKRPILLRLRENWRDWLIRGMLLSSVLGITVGLIIYEVSYSNSSSGEDTLGSMSGGMGPSVLS